VATPERQLVHEEVSEVQIPGSNGYMGILPGHAPLLSQLTTGTLSYVAGGRKRCLAVHGGFVEVLPEHVRVLADRAERAEEIDVERAKKALKRAQDRTENPALGVDPARALSAMARAQARLEAADQK
jgi:F-type H+-transporting ATPase subunit epsilon